MKKSMPVVTTTPRAATAVATKAVATKAVATKAVATKAVATKAVATKAVATKTTVIKATESPRGKPGRISGGDRARGAVASKVTRVAERPAKGSGQRIGYVRVSSFDQNPDRQLEALPLHRTFADRVSGRDTARPQLQALLSYVREGDTVVVHSLDRLARNLDDLRRLVTTLTERGIAVEFLAEHLIFTGDDSAMSVLLLSMLGAVAEFERALIRERQREGIQLAKQRGAYCGRPKSLSPVQVAALRTEISAGKPKAQVAREFGISRQTLYAYVREPAVPAQG